MGGGMTLRSPASRTDADARVTALVKRHGASLLKAAKGLSLCADDAQDAYQRALEIYLRRLEDLDPLTEAAYMRVVVRNEALSIRRQRQQHVAEPGDLDARVADLPPADERLEREERVRRAAEVLHDLKPDEAPALLLHEQAHSYVEIGERFGWTYTNVNRPLSSHQAFRPATTDPSALGIRFGRRIETTGSTQSRPPLLLLQSLQRSRRSG